MEKVLEPGAAVVDVLDKPEDLAKEQEVLDEHDDSIAELTIRM